MTDEPTPIDPQHDAPADGVEQQITTDTALLAIARAIERLAAATREQTAATARAADKVARAIDRTAGVWHDAGG